eukprot:378450-Hanusia_phi.AAC.4
MQQHTKLRRRNANRNAGWGCPSTITNKGAYCSFKQLQSVRRERFYSIVSIVDLHNYISWRTCPGQAKHKLVERLVVLGRSLRESGTWRVRSVRALADRRCTRGQGTGSWVVAVLLSSSPL